MDFYKLRSVFGENPTIVFEHLALEAENLCNEHHDSEGQPTDIGRMWDKVSDELKELIDFIHEAKSETK